MATNRGARDAGWAEPRGEGTVEELDPTAAVQRLSGGSALLVDVREPAEYEPAHAAGAINIPQYRLAD